MIHFNQIANPSTPSAKPMCVACEGRGASIDGESRRTGGTNHPTGDRSIMNMCLPWVAPMMTDDAGTV